MWSKRTILPSQRKELKQQQKKVRDAENLDKEIKSHQGLCDNVQNDLTATDVRD